MHFFIPGRGNIRAVILPGVNDMSPRWNRIMPMRALKYDAVGFPDKTGRCVGSIEVNIKSMDVVRGRFGIVVGLNNELRVFCC